MQIQAQCAGSSVSAWLVMHTPPPPFLTQGLRVRMGIATALLQEGSALLHSGVLSKAQGEQGVEGGGVG